MQKKEKSAGVSTYRRGAAYYMVISLSLLAVLMMVMGVYYMFSYAKREVMHEMRFSAQQIIEKIGKSHLYKSQYLVQSVADITSTLIDRGHTDREVVKSMLYALVHENPDITGMGIAFSPNGFDSLDHLHKGEPNCDAKGRFLPYYTLNERGVPVLDPLYAYAVDGPNSYYFVPMRSRRPYVTDIYTSKVIEDTLTMFTISWPLFSQGDFAGVVIADVSLYTERKLIESFDMYDGQGTIYLLSTKQRVITHTQNSAWVNQPIHQVDSLHAPTREEQNLLHRGQTVFRTENQELLVLHPLFLADYHVPLTLGLVLSSKVVYRQIKATMLPFMGVGLLLFLLWEMMLLHWYRVQKALSVTASCARPVERLPWRRRGSLSPYRRAA